MNVSNPIYLESGRAVTRPNALADEGLRQRIELLDKSDRLLVEMSSVIGLSHRRIAELMGVDVGTISRRLRRIAARVHDPLVARLLDASTCPLGPDYRQIGVEHFLAGKTLARIAAGQGTSIAFVRGAIAAVCAWHRHTRTPSRELAMH